MKLMDKAVIFCASGCWIGYIPFAPGTVGSILGLALYFVVSDVNPYLVAAWTVLFIVFASWIAGAAEKILQQKDPGCIVIDEICGQVVTFIGLPFTLTTAVAGFFVFRAFDIIKPFPIRKLERNVSGGVGVVLDDVVAGIFSNLVLRIGYELTDKI